MTSFSGQRKPIYFCASILSVSTVYFLINLGYIWGQYRNQVPGHPAAYLDYFALWSYPKIASTNSVTDLYDFAVLHARQVALGMEPSAEKPFPYPPSALLLLWPLTLLPYDAGFFVMTAGTLVLFVGIVWATCSRSPLCLLGVIVAPATTASIFSGQTGFLSAALLTAGIRVAKTRPVVAGVCIGLLSYKPQLGLLVPVALAAAGLWPAFAVACVSAVAMAVAATLAFGWHTWVAWVASLPAYAHWSDSRPPLLSPTVSGTLRLAGCSLSVATGAQLVVAAIVVTLVWRCFRRNPGRLATAALLVGTFLVTPHALFYDLPMVTAAMALYVTDRLNAGATFSAIELSALGLAMLLPMFMFMNVFLLPFAVIPLLLLFGIIIRHAQRLTDRHATARGEMLVYG